MKKITAIIVGVAAVLSLSPLIALAEPRAIHEGIGTVSLEPAARGPQTQINPPPPDTSPPVPTGLWGLPFAPEGLSDCDEMNFYRIQFGLPERFSGIGWRESNCRNEDGVKTYCCYGYWQMYTSLHLRDHRLAPRYAQCEVSSFHDYNSDNPLEKQKQACAAKALYDVNGTSPWAATR